jgi:hypothetical protein
MTASSICYPAFAVVAIVVLTVGTLRADDPAGIELVRGGERQELSDQKRSRIADPLPKLFSTCSINSRDHPQTFASLSLATIWDNARARDHLTLQVRAPSNFVPVILQSSPCGSSSWD